MGQPARCRKKGHAYWPALWGPANAGNTYKSTRVLMAFIPCQTHYTSLTKTASAEHVVQFRPPHLLGHLQKLGYSLCKTITGTFDNLGSILSGMEASFARQNLSILSIPCCTATETTGRTSLRLAGRGKPWQISDFDHPKSRSPKTP